ncbi:MAG TPA: ATP-binding protein [Bacteroidales bacterium]|nr:ATP-binding protein [Bacteroidales bacterium]HRZ48702.1 ATP-binding protein [Bacteroidales bacterium]
MIKASVLYETISRQKEQLLRADIGYLREVLPSLPNDLPNHALIISGIRRSGKSTLQRQLIHQSHAPFLFVNFDTPALLGFDVRDFQLLDELMGTPKPEILYFDEIQNVEGWEVYVREKLDQGYRIVVTGSNASLLSREMGTRLTGRHITRELFPFSFMEFCGFKEMAVDSKALEQYLSTGGFPEYLERPEPEILSTLLNDILYRDIAVRYQIRNVKSLLQLVTFLATNTAKPVSATKLTRVLELKSTATILEYLSHLENAWLIQLLPKFSFSYKVQLVNARKVYFADPALQQAITGSFSDDHGRRLETMVFWELRRKHARLYYFNERGHECDFVVMDGKRPDALIQVCHTLNHDNETREVTGLLEAMNHMNLNQGLLLTFDQKDTIVHDNKRIEVLPVYEWLR